MAFDSYESESISSINVTPLVDVMLVLLVIFMVTAPILQQGVQLELPKENLETIEDGDTEQLVVSIDKKGDIFIGEGNAIGLAELSTKISAIINQREDKRVFIKADKSIIYEKVMDVIGTLKNGGVYKVGLVTDPE